MCRSVCSEENAHARASEKNKNFKEVAKTLISGGNYKLDGFKEVRQDPLYTLPEPHALTRLFFLNWAHRAFWAATIRFRPAADRRRFRLVGLDFSLLWPSRAAMAPSIPPSVVSSSVCFARSSAAMFARFMASQCRSLRLYQGHRTGLKYRYQPSFPTFGLKLRSRAPCGPARPSCRNRVDI